MKRRHVLAVLGLSFITLGIYVIYWLYKTRKEMLTFLPDKKAIPRVIFLFIPFIAMIAVMVVSITVSLSLTHGSPSEDAWGVISIILIMTTFLAMFVVSFWWFYRYFRAVEAVTHGNDAMLLYTLWIVLTVVGFGPIWVLIVQNDFNKFIDNGHRPLKSPGYPHNPDAQQQWQPPQPQQYGQPHHPASPQPYQAPSTGYPQAYPQHPPQPAPEHNPHHAEHVAPQHRQHEQHHGHQQGHHGHPDQPHDDPNAPRPPQQYQG